MNYKEAREYMEEISEYGSVLGLDNIRELLQRMGNPEKELTIIHVAGTNGKGSVVSYLSTVCAKAGYQVGRYVSPTICKYRERIQINNRYIEKEDFAEGITQIKEAIGKMMQQGFSHPTPFEVETALALWYYKKKQCNLVVLECGLGGMEDATNVIEKKICTVFTSISRDHMGILGESLEEIAETKSGIMRKGVTAVSIAQNQAIEAVLRQQAEKNGTEIIFADDTQAVVAKSDLAHQVFSYGAYENLEISLAGPHQIKNAVLAIEVIEVLKSQGFDIPRQAVYQGFAETKWVGRLTTICKKPWMIVDGAHNEEAAKQLAATIKEQLQDKKLIFLMGVFKDKEYEKIAKETAMFAEHIVTFTIPNTERALSGLELAYAIRPYNNKVTVADSLKEALEMALLLAGEDGVILAFGSLSFLGRLMELTADLDKTKKFLGV